MIFLPVRTDSPVRRAPYVNMGIIALNVLIFVLTDLVGQSRLGGFGERIKSDYNLDPVNLELWQFFSYQFLHGDWLHLLGNMWFLWIFGNSVNSKMGNIAYLFFYLSAGVFSGVGFALLSDNPCIGASGAIAGVTTAFLVLYPHSQITVFYWLWFYVGTWHIKATLLIGIKIILWDNIIAPNLNQGFSAVAHEAHVAGYLFGFVLCLFLLLIRALPRDQYDILALLKRYYQRKQMKIALADPVAQARARYGRVGIPETGARIPRAVPVSPEEEALMQMRSEISELVYRGEYATAADRYEALVTRDPNQVLARQTMLAVANQLAEMGRYPQAAAAYEKHLRTYPKDPETARIKLMLGIIYAKYLQQNEAAEPFLRDSAQSLTDPDQREQASRWHEVVLASLGRGGASPA